MASYCRSDYTKAETTDTTTNVPLLSDDLLDDESSIGQHQDSAWVVKDDVEDAQEVRFAISSTHSRSGICFPCKFSKTALLLLAIIAILVIVCVVLSALLASRKSVTRNLQCVTEGCIDAAHNIFHSIDFTVKPCDDFYEFACGGWMKSNPIPESKSFWGVYSILQEENDRLVKQKLTETKDGSETTLKAKTFYDACMDETTINSVGSKPIQDIIHDLGDWDVSEPRNLNFTRMLNAVHKKYSVDVFFSANVGADDKNSSKNVIRVDQAGLSLSRTYYLLNMSDPKLMAYLKYMTTVVILLQGGNESKTREQMKEVLKFEMKLAKIFVPPGHRSEIDEMYNKTNIAKLKKLCYKIPWLGFFQNYFDGITKITESEEVVVYATRYLEALSPVIDNASDTLLYNYMMWRVVYNMAPLLSKEFRDAHQQLKNILTGSKKPEDLWKHCMSETNEAIGMALGALFIKEAFEERSKVQATYMIDNIRASFKKSLADLDWMDDKTRQAAEAKADAVMDMIGYPNYITDPTKLAKRYEKLHFKAGEYFQNSRNAYAFYLLDMLTNLRKPVDKYKWEMIPSEVNAYYSPSRNQIVFPAGILQSPYYNKKFPKSVNFGGIGAVVGHELSHGFDNSGRMYDKFGNYGVQWWTKRSINQYKMRSKCMIKQYSKFSYFDKHVNGKYTLGENIADNGGLKAAYNAYKEWERKQGTEPLLPLLNMTADQIFFTAFAQSWCANIRKEKAKVRLDDDPHSPNKFRVLGSLSNFDAFASAFKCPLSSKMNPPSKCHIW